ncbi:aromatase/cyclase [Streptomyces sp. NRRL S-646]|uniref:aromatase/cyclase n=1 Tax=Streptomyces sp. NRRL S-646 TaxID=1463917 RepID=UPI0004C4A56A|nr:SRPBCC family protein [Streptomyces sp. NRRL S-646]
MPAPALHRTSHRIEVAAPAGVVYGLIADAERWPLFFAPNVYVELLDLEGPGQRLRMWARAGGRITSWITRRTLDPAARRITFRQEVTSAAVDSMRGVWNVEQRAHGSALLTLERQFTAAHGHLAPDRIGDANIRAHLANLKSLAERWAVLDELVVTVEDTVRVQGPSELVYGFLYRAAAWPGTVPGVTGVRLAEDVPGIQTLHTQDGAGDSAAVRLCFPHGGLIVYKVTQPPELVSGQAGEWSVEPDPAGVTVRARHQVVLNEHDVARVLGADAGLADARRHVRERVGRHSAALLDLARRHAEDAVRALTPSGLPGWS